MNWSFKNGLVGLFYVVQRSLFVYYSLIESKEDTYYSSRNLLITLRRAKELDGSLMCP